MTVPDGCPAVLRPPAAGAARWPTDDVGRQGSVVGQSSAICSAMTASAIAPASTRPDAALAGVAGAAAHGLHRLGRLGRLAGRGRRGQRARSRPWSRPAATAASIVSVIGISASSRVLSPSTGLPAGPDALRGGPQHRHHVGRRSSSLLPAAAAPARRNAVPQIGPDVPPIRRGDDDGDLLEEGADVGPVVGVPVLRARSRSRGPASSRSRRRRRRRRGHRTPSRCRRRSARWS